MPRFEVLFKGSNCWLRMGAGKHLGLLYKIRVVPHGFHANRHVDAASPAEAAERAEAILMKQLATACANPKAQPFSISVEKVEESPDVPASSMPGCAYVWYSEDSKDDAPGDQVVIRELLTVRARRWYDLLLAAPPLLVIAFGGWPAVPFGVLGWIASLDEVATTSRPVWARALLVLRNTAIAGGAYLLIVALRMRFLGR